jgi:hypothetical protein
VATANSTSLPPSPEICAVCAVQSSPLAPSKLSTNTTNSCVPASVWSSSSAVSILPVSTSAAFSDTVT